MKSSERFGLSLWFIELQEATVHTARVSLWCPVLSAESQTQKATNWFHFYGIVFEVNPGDGWCVKHACDISTREAEAGASSVGGWG